MTKTVQFGCCSTAFGTSSKHQYGKPPNRRKAVGRSSFTVETEITMKMSRRWAMPNRDTFAIKPIAELLDRWIKPTDVVIDPFAKRQTWHLD